MTLTAETRRAAFSDARYGLFYQGTTLTSLVFSGVAHAESHRQARKLSSAQWHIKALESFDGKLGHAAANAMVIPEFNPGDLAEALEKQNLIDQVRWSRKANHLDGCPVRETKGIAKCQCHKIAVEQGIPDYQEHIDMVRLWTREERIKVL